MKRIYILLVALFAGLAANAQEIRTVKGIVLDSLTRQPEPAAILQFFKVGDDSKAVAFTTTAEDGTFVHTFDIKGNYYLLFDNMGRKQARRYFKINGEEVIDLGEILVEDAAELLKAGTVTALRPLVKMEVDKITYNVEDDVDSKTSTVLDMLRKVPMVSVDGQDNISVNGSSSFVVYVDGKPNQMMSQNASQIFKMMPASSVKNVEVVTNPGVSSPTRASAMMPRAWAACSTSPPTRPSRAVRARPTACTAPSVPRLPPAVTAAACSAACSRASSP